MDPPLDYRARYLREERLFPGFPEFLQLRRYQVKVEYTTCILYSQTSSNEQRFPFLNPRRGESFHIWCPLRRLVKPSLASLLVPGRLAIGIPGMQKGLTFKVHLSQVTDNRRLKKTSMKNVSPVFLSSLLENYWNLLKKHCKPFSQFTLSPISLTRNLNTKDTWRHHHLFNLTTNTFRSLTRRVEDTCRSPPQLWLYISWPCMHVFPECIAFITIALKR